MAAPAPVAAEPLNRVPDAVAPPPGHARIPLADGLRAIAATSILAFHAASHTGADRDGVWGNLTAMLAVGVPVFFLISGFLLYRPFVAADVLGASEIRTWPYLWRRALRIIPLYWFALTVIFLATASGTDRPGGFFSGEPWWIFYGFLQVYDPGAYGGGLQQAWTLCIEVTFYLALPLYAIVLAKQRKRGRGLRFELLLLAGLAVLSLVIREILAASPDTAHLVRTLPAYFYLFAIGMALALLSVRAQQNPTSRVLQWVSHRSGYAWLVAGTLYLLTAFVILDTGSTLALYVMFGVVAFFVMIPAVFDDSHQGPVRCFLANPFVMWVGLISYGVYLWHPQVISALENAGLAKAGAGFLWQTPFIFAATLVLSGAVYYAIERPFLRLKKRVPVKRRANTRERARQGAGSPGREDLTPSLRGSES